MSCLLNVKVWSPTTALPVPSATITTVASVERHDLRSRPSRIHPWATASALWAARGALRASPVPPNPPDATPRREVEAEAVSS